MPSTSRAASPAVSSKATRRIKHDDDEWEVMNESDNHQSNQVTTSSPSRRRRSTRSPYPSPSKRGSAKTRQPATRPNENSALTLDTASRLFFAFLSFTFEIIVNAVKLLKYPFTLALAMYLFSLIVSRAYMLLTVPLHNSVSLICNLPVLSWSLPGLCQSSATSKSNARKTPVDYPMLMEIETDSFEKLLDNSMSGADLVFDIKKAEMASADLNTVLMATDLPAKTYLSKSILDFVDSAKTTGRALQRFDAKIEGAIDQITSFNQYTFDRLAESTGQRSSSLASRLLRTALFMPAPNDVAIPELFDQVMQMLEIHMTRLITEGHTMLGQLDGLEERMAAIHLIVSQESEKINNAKEDLLAELWTILGGNRRRLQKYSNHKELLADIDTARMRALAHVVAAVTTLESTQSNLEDLRERASGTGLVGYEIPLEAHLMSMKVGIERIAAWRTKTLQGKKDALARLIGRD